MKGQDSLQLFDVGVLLQALSNNLKVGVLAVRSGAREKYLRLGGSKLECVYGKRPRVSLAKVLYNHRATEKVHLKKAMDALGGSPNETDLASFLVEQGWVSQPQLNRAWNYQLVEEVLELFYWKNIGFEFYAGATPPILDELPERGIRAIGQPVGLDNILIQCTKISDDISKFDSVMPSLRDVYDLQIGSLEELRRVVPDQGQREFLLLIDGIRDMREVLRDMRMNRYEVLQLFYRFHQEQRLRAKNSFELLMLAENRRDEFTPEKRARLLERVVELGVEGFGVLLPLAETYVELGESRKAARCFMRHARLCLRDGDQDGALDSAHRAVALVRKDPEVREFEIAVLLDCGREADAGASCMELGALRQARGDFVGARSALERAIELAPRDAPILERLAEVLEEQGEKRLCAVRRRQAGAARRDAGNLDAAIGDYRRALVAWPGSWSTRLRLVDTLHEAGRDDEGVQEMADIVGLVTNRNSKLPPLARMNLLVRVEDRLRRYGGLPSSAALALGRAYVTLKRPDRAERVLRDAASELAAAKRFRTAVEMYGDLIELVPGDLGVRRHLATAHKALGDVNRALGQYRRMGNQLVAKERWAEALEVFEQMLGVNPTSLDAHRGVAKALLYLGETERASEHYHRMGLLHRGCGRGSEALPYLREAVEKRPNDAALLDEYCELLLEVGDDDSETLTALNALVELRMARGQPDLAAMALTRILDIDNRHPGARQILQDAARALLVRAEESQEIRKVDMRLIIEKARAMKAAGGSPPERA